MVTAVILEDMISYSANVNLIDVGVGSTVYVTAGVNVTTTGPGSRSIYADANSVVHVAGSVFSINTAIFMYGTGSGRLVTITQSGTVIGGFYGVAFEASGQLYNDGFLSAATAARFDGGGRLVNTGSIVGGAQTIQAISATETFTLINSGTITGTTAFVGASAIDRIINTGLIEGVILLLGSNDLYDGRNGMQVGAINGGEGDDEIYGSLTAPNILLGAMDDDILEGGAADDRLIGGVGADYMDGKGGRDTASYENSVRTVLVDMEDMSRNQGEAAGDVFVSIERVVGGFAADTLRGDAGANVLVGGGGNDVLEGRGGNDWLIGGSGSDLMIGGAGRRHLFRDRSGRRRQGNGQSGL